MRFSLQTFVLDAARSTHWEFPTRVEVLSATPLTGVSFRVVGRVAEEELGEPFAALPLDELRRIHTLNFRLVRDTTALRSDERYVTTILEDGRPLHLVYSSD